jgi:transcriptional regulator with XRE-family HTH domain
VSIEVRPTAEPTDVGAWLRSRREQSGLTLRQIADTTKLSVRTLEALERNRVSQLPGGLYCRAIVRAYATEIGLDPEQAVGAFLTQHPQDPATLPPAKSIAAVPTQRHVLRTWASVIGMLIPVFAGVFYFTLSAGGSDAPRQVVDVMPYVLPKDGNAIAIMISVSAPCRLQILADGRAVLARQVEAGELLRMELGDNVVLLGDDAGAVHFSINGRAGRALGEAGDSLSVRIARADYHAWLIQP